MNIHKNDCCCAFEFKRNKNKSISDGRFYARPLFIFGVLPRPM